MHYLCTVENNKVTTYYQLFKKNAVKMKTMKTTLLLTAATLMMAACSSTDLYDEQTATGDTSEARTEIANAFDYCLTVNIPVTFNYNAKNAFVQIVDMDERDAGVVMTGRQPRVLYAASTGPTGRYQGTMVIPASYIGKKVYAVTRSMGAVSNMAATVTRNGLVVDEAEAATRGVKLANKSVSEELLANLDAELAEEHDNSSKLSERSNDISIKVTKDVDYVDVTFIYGGAGVWISGHYKDADFSCQKDEYEHDSWFPFDTSCDLYYFLYTDDNVPTKEYIDTYYINDHHRVVDYVNNGNSGIYGHKDGKIGTTVRITQNDGITTRIPAGTRIGWVITHPYYAYRDIWDASLSGWTVPYLYSISDYNPGGCSQSIRYQWGQGENKEIVYGFEDAPLQDGIKLWGETWEQHQEHIAAGQPTSQHYFWSVSDKDYNDVMFVVKASDPDAIADDDIPVLPPAPVTYQEESVEGTLLYEDLFPQQGDYDMNDVVIAYRLTKYFDNDNRLVKLGYEFTPVWDGASYHSAFSFLLDGVTTEPVKVFDDHKKVMRKTIKGEVASGPLVGMPKDALGWDAFNPFITVANTGYEVHLTKKPASSAAKLDGLDVYQKAYVNDSNFPFAMNIPYLGFQVVTEKVRIDTEYPRFIDWVTSKGANATDWYIRN